MKIHEADPSVVVAGQHRQRVDVLLSAAWDTLDRAGLDEVNGSQRHPCIVGRNLDGTPGGIGMMIPILNAIERRDSHMGNPYRVGMRSRRNLYRPAMARMI